MNATLAMFPGQGSQFVGMGKSLQGEFPYIRTIFEEAEEAARLGIRKLCFDGPESDLRLTANTQPCVLAVSVATWEVLRRESGFAPAAFAGHSLGEYSALVAAGTIQLSDAARLVRERGLAMQEAVRVGVGAMAAIIGLDAATVEGLCREVSSDSGLVEVANYNCPTQTVVSGLVAGVTSLCDRVKTLKATAIPLPVSAPFHCRLMEPAAERMRPLLAAIRYAPPSAPVLANTTGDAASPYDASFLADQIVGAVRWTQTLETAHRRGCTRFVEIGPGKVLMGLARKTLPKDVTILVTESVPETIARLKS